MPISECQSDRGPRLAEAIQSLDLGPIRYKLMNPDDGCGWTLQEVDRVEILYRRFLYLVGLYPDRAIVPNKDIDRFWHAHILDTVKYQADTQAVFGYFLHHFPYFGARGPADRAANELAFAETSALYVRHFGENVFDYGPNSRSGASFCGGPSCRDIVPGDIGGGDGPYSELRPNA